MYTKVQRPMRNSPSTTPRTIPTIVFVLLVPDDLRWSCEVWSATDPKARPRTQAESQATEAVSLCLTMESDPRAFAKGFWIASCAEGGRRGFVGRCMSSGYDVGHQRTNTLYSKALPLQIENN